MRSNWYASGGANIGGYILKSLASVGLLWADKLDAISKPRTCCLSRPYRSS